ncbi:MAG: AI-2E family transporter [Burkholderiaceae bacterium]
MQDKAFVLLLVLSTLGFCWILWPFYGAVFWGVVLAILFTPLNRRILRRFGMGATLTALATLVIILFIVILPLTVVGLSVAQEVTDFYRRTQSREIDFARYFGQVMAALPDWVSRLLQGFGVFDMPDLQKKMSSMASAGGKEIATRAFDIGQNTLDLVVGFFVSLYLTFFLLRDGTGLARRIGAAVPLDPGSKRKLFAKFGAVIRATVKGNVVVAAVQGTLGGIAFWYLGVHGTLLWASLMAFLSLLPAIGAALVWGPVAIFFLATGEIGKGLGLVVWGTAVIGLVDNVLRPLLVGKDIRMPDYLVLISTIGGMAVFGINGFVIGPVIAAIFVSAWGIFAEGRDPDDAPTHPVA